ncbi:MAG: DNA cytosine methyltransferase [Coprobacillus sp.]|nr:DNA cytosine methyltransferase [Coprobacillus sp.]
MINVLIDKCMDEKCLTPRRNEFGRKYRKEYEEGPNRLSRHLMRNLEPRDDGLTNTLTSVQKDNLLICKEESVTPCAIRGREPQVEEVGNLYKGQTAWESNQRGRIYDANGLSPTLNTHTGGGFEPKFMEGHYRIRKLTEWECFRLMDVDEKDIDTIQASGVSRTQQYKMAGNSIVVSCLYHLFRKMFVETENEERQLTLF